MTDMNITLVNLFVEMFNDVMYSMGMNVCVWMYVSIYIYICVCISLSIII